MTSVSKTLPSGHSSEIQTSHKTNSTLDQVCRGYLLYVLECHKDCDSLLHFCNSSTVGSVWSMEVSTACFVWGSPLSFFGKVHHHLF